MIVYSDGIEEYMVHVVFFKEGKTKMTLEDESGKQKIYNLDIKRDSYKIGE